MSERFPAPDEIEIIRDGSAGYVTFRVTFPKADACVYENSYNLNKWSSSKPLTLARVLADFETPETDR